MTPFQQAIDKVVKMIPSGKVMSYGQVAAYVGAPRGARLIGWVMRSMEGKSDLPWWRVLNNEGRITIKGNKFNTPPVQKNFLEEEGIEVKDDFTIDMKKYRYIPTQEEIQQMSLSDEYIDMIHRKGYL